MCARMPVLPAISGCKRHISGSVEAEQSTLKGALPKAADINAKSIDKQCVMCVLRSVLQGKFDSKITLVEHP